MKVKVVVRWASRLALVGMLVAATGCGLGKSTSGELSGQTDGQSEAGGTRRNAPLRFAIVGPLTGDAAEYGKGLQNGVTLALEEINAAGGIAGGRVEAVYFDDKCNPQDAATVAQRVVSDGGFTAVIGHVCSSATLAAMPVYEQAGLTTISGSSTNPKITALGYKHFFRTINKDDAQGREMVEYAVKNMGAKRLGIFYGNDDYGRGLLISAVAKAKELAVEVVGQETYVPGVDKDFSAQLTKMAAARPDVLLLMTYYTEGGLILSQREKAGLANVPVLAAAGNQHPQFATLGGQGAEGALVFAYYDPYNPAPAAQEFVKKWQARFNRLPSEQEAYGYEIPFILKQALESGATRENLHEAVRRVRYEGVTGLTTFNESGDVSNKRSAILVVEGGKLKTYTPKQ